VVSKHSYIEIEFTKGSVIGESFTINDHKGTVFKIEDKKIMNDSANDITCLSNKGVKFAKPFDVIMNIEEGHTWLLEL